MNMLYIIGEPGVGKSTLLAHLTRGLEVERTDSPIPFRRYDCGVVELGVRRPDFPGTDAYPMNAQPAVVQFLTDVQPKLVIAEGDRLGNHKFFDEARLIGYHVQVVAIVGPEVAEMQRRIRGSNQDRTWLKGRRTKVANLITGEDAHCINAGPLGTMESTLRKLDNPVANAFINTRES